MNKYSLVEILESAVAGQKKDLHLRHIEQLAKDTGDINLIKRIFNEILDSFSDKTKNITISQKIDGVPLLFGNTKEGFFVGLKNQAFKKGVIDKEQIYFSKEEIPPGLFGNNTELLKNMFSALKPLVSKNKIYFAELLFSDHPGSSGETKNQKKVRINPKEVLAQPNLLHYRIKEVQDSQEFGILGIAMANTSTIEGLSATDFKNGTDLKSTSKVFVTSGQVSLILDEKDPVIRSLRKKINSLKEIKKDKSFKITSHMLSGSDIDDISEIKEEIINLLKDKRQIIGQKGVSSNYDVDEGLVIRGNDFLVKFVSKNFFVTADKHYNKKESISEAIDRSSLNLKRLVAIFPGKFLPFHKGHLQTFNNLQSLFGDKNVIISTGDSPTLSFEDKKKLMIAAGVPADQIKNSTGVKMYSFEMAKKFLNVNEDIAVYALGDKDEDKDRFSSGKRVKFFVSGKKDFPMIKDKVMKSILEPDNSKKTNYFFLVKPTAVKNEEGKDYKASPIREAIKNGNIDKISNSLPYKITKEIEGILSKL